MDPSGASPATPDGRTHRADPASAGWRLWNWCIAALREAGYLLMPGECALCGAEDQALCLRCAAELRRATAAPFRADGAADALMGMAGESHLPVMAAGHYREALSAAILAFKNHGRVELGPPLARCLARSLQRLLVELPATVRGGVDAADGAVQGSGGRPAILLVPIPSSGAGWRRRGFDPVAALLGSMAREKRLPPGVVVAPLLGARARPPWRNSRQKGLGRSARRSNVQGSMKIRPRMVRKFLPTAKPSSYLVVLADDVLTTGSTLREAVRTLEKWGFSAHAAVVVAATRAPRQDNTGANT